MSRWWPALTAQGLGWILAMFIVRELEPAWQGTVLEAGLAGAWAALLSHRLHEPAWRSPMQFAFSVALYAGQHSVVPPPLWAGAFAISMLLFGGGLTGRRAPLYLTQARAVDALLACIPENLDGVCLDVGAGLGSFLLQVAPLRPRLTFRGIERAPLTALLGDLRCRLRACGRIGLGDLWHADLSEASVVYAFLSPEAMEALWTKAVQEMRTDTWLVVNAFAVPGQTPERSERYGDGESEVVYAYRLPGPGRAAGRADPAGARPADAAMGSRRSSAPR